MRRLIALALACLLLAGCTASPPRATVELPLLALSPAALGHELVVQQRLHFAFGSQQRELEALLEVDGREVRLAVQALGQAGVRLRWDGQALEQQRASWLPQQVRGERVLSDLQFALWPIEAIRAALPARWTVEAEGGSRCLRHDGTTWLRVVQEGPGRHRLENRAEGYALLIESAAAGATP